MRTVELAQELGVTPSQILVTLAGNHIPFTHSPNTGNVFVSDEMAERVRRIYRNAATQPVQEPTPTPLHQRDIDPADMRDFDELRRIRWTAARGYDV